jgi:hypothetical protein
MPRQKKHRKQAAESKLQQMQEGIATGDAMKRRLLMQRSQLFSGLGSEAAF